MSNIPSFSSLTTMFQTSNIVYQSVNLTDEIKIGLEYNRHCGLLNIFVKNTGNNIEFPSQINILSNNEDNQPDLKNEIIDIPYREEDEPKICIELSNIYVYDVFDENENDLCQPMITSSSLVFSSSSLSSSSSCFDEHTTTDNDDGYSTHSLDDIEQQPQSKLIVPFVSYQHQYYDSEECISSIHRLIDQIIWLNPFKKPIKQMMNNHLFNCLI